MKKLTRLIALILCAAMLFSMVGCSQAPEETTAPPTEPPATTVPKEPSANEVYAQAREALDGAADISLEVLITTYTTVDGDEFSERSTQTLTYRGLGTGEPLVAMDEKIEFSVHSEDYEKSIADGEDTSTHYTEIYSHGTVYAELRDTYKFSGPVAAEEILDRYTPVVLLNAELYGSITSETTAGLTTITFAEPSASESWAVPAEAELVDATGTALVNAEGALEQMNYTVSYTYGPSEVKLEVQTRPLDTAAEVSVPANPDAYPTLQYIDILRQAVVAGAMALQADSATASSLESMYCQAAGVLRNQSSIINLHGRKEDTILKIENGIYFMDYSTYQSEEYDQEELFLDGKYTYTVNDGLPTSQSGVSWEDIREYASGIMLAHIVSMDYWEDAVMTDMGSVYLIEFTLNENFGNTIQNGICDMLWEDASFLYNLASAYETNEVTGYLSLDKYSGLSVAGGYYYEGTHTIEGTDYTLSLQFDQSLEAPSKGAYQEITDKMPEEAEPENKATPLFYHVTGPDGQEMWLLGTIHVGDERTAYLPEEIYNAFAASDALALECDTEAFDELLENDDDLSEEVSNLYFYSDGTTLESLMEEEAYARAVQFMKAIGSYNMNMPYAKPYLWSQSIDDFYLRQSYQLHGDQGVEERLHDWADELDKEILEIESSMFQLKMLTGFSNDLQLLMLEDAMEETAQEYWDSLTELYELWCSGDEAALREELSSEVDTSEFTEEELAEYEAQLPLIEEYNKAVTYDRNEGMLDAAIGYLESGETIFYAVGLAHLLDNVNGLVDALREAGYTVELVTYQ